MKSSVWWQTSLAIAQVVLADRKNRRQFITGFLVFIIAYFAFGNWGIEGWLEGGLWRMLIFWGFLGVMLLFLMLFALFDVLAAIGEERRKAGLGKVKVDEESSLD